MTENQVINSHYQYPDPGSNRDGLLQRCLRPSRLPIPPSGHGQVDVCAFVAAKVIIIFEKYE